MPNSHTSGKTTESGCHPWGFYTQQTFLPQEQPAPPTFPLPTCLFLSTSGIISQPSPSTVHEAEQGASPESRVTDRQTPAPWCSGTLVRDSQAVSQAEEAKGAGTIC